MSKPTIIAIDGPGAVGKNAVGSLLAKKLGYRFFDTGAMYRALTWLALQLHIDLANEEALGELAAKTEIELIPPVADAEGRCRVLVDGHDIGPKIRDEEVEKGVSLVAKVAKVRQQLAAKQRRMASKDRVVMAGRDIGTVVLPHADLKIFLSASPEERARRRYLELLREGKSVSFDEVLADLRRRDEIDSTRASSPLQPAEDAQIIDTDALNVDQVVIKILKIIEEGQWDYSTLSPP